MSDSRINIPRELAEQYAKTKNVSLEQAYSNLEANLQREIDGVDLAQQYQALIKGFRTLSPQLHGVISREIDMASNLKALSLKIRELEWSVETLSERLDFEREVFKKAIQLLNARNEPFYMKVWNRIKCLLKN